MWIVNYLSKRCIHHALLNGIWPRISPLAQYLELFNECYSWLGKNAYLEFASAVFFGINAAGVKYADDLPVRACLILTEQTELTEQLINGQYKLPM